MSRRDVPSFPQFLIEKIWGQTGRTPISYRSSSRKEKQPWQGGETALGLDTMSDLRHRIENLSASKKAELLDAVWESLEADALSLTDAQRAELDHRIERHEQNPSDVIPWEQVRANLFISAKSESR
jgi:putative addiction module component (TIGR02574 family)